MLGIRLDALDRSRMLGEHLPGLFESPCLAQIIRKVLENHPAQAGGKLAGLRSLRRTGKRSLKEGRGGLELAHHFEGMGPAGKGQGLGLDEVAGVDLLALHPRQVLAGPIAAVVEQIKPRWSELDESLAVPRLEPSS